jgi:hypothetical protein
MNIRNWHLAPNIGRFGSVKIHDADDSHVAEVYGESIAQAIEDANGLCCAVNTHEDLLAIARLLAVVPIEEMGFDESHADRTLEEAVKITVGDVLHARRTIAAAKVRYLAVKS